MAQNKTVKSDNSVEKFIESLDDEERKKDCFQVLSMMKELTNEEPKMWVGGIVGFGDYHYTYDSGREGDFFRTGFSPRKQALTLYIMSGFEEYEELLAKLGKHKTCKSCLYIKKLDDIDPEILKEMILLSWAWMLEQYPE